jgi:membrane-associated protease RseP (regulator of RpoE activity)
MGLFFWLALLNIGVGLFNLLPMGPLDGGRILLTTFTKFFGEKKAKKINKIITWVLFIMFLLLLISSFIK